MRARPSLLTVRRLPPSRRRHLIARRRASVAPASDSGALDTCRRPLSREFGAVSGDGDRRERLGVPPGSASSHPQQPAARTPSLSERSGDRGATGGASPAAAAPASRPPGPGHRRGGTPLPASPRGRAVRSRRPSRPPATSPRRRRGRRCRRRGASGPGSRRSSACAGPRRRGRQKKGGLPVVPDKPPGARGRLLLDLGRGGLSGPPDRGHCRPLRNHAWRGCSSPLRTTMSSVRQRD
jgi:hypothetical protein